jgi:hypothetical protein
VLVADKSVSHDIDLDSGKMTVPRLQRLCVFGLCVSSIQETSMAAHSPAAAKATGLIRKQLVDLLNEDLSREYQAIIAHDVYSQVLKRDLRA